MRGVRETEQKPAGAWDPQVNGVVRTMKRVIAESEAMGHIWEIVHPGDGFRTVPLPTYPEIKLALFARRKIEERFHEFEPDAIHIATEGTLGMAGRTMCLIVKHPFSTAYHTRFPEYVSARLPVPISVGYSFVHWFHKYSGKVMVPTPSMVEELRARNFINLVAWTRGVDTETRWKRILRPLPNSTCRARKSSSATGRSWKN